MSPRALDNEHRAWPKGLLAKNCFVNAIIDLFPPSSSTERRGLSAHLRSSIASRSDLEKFSVWRPLAQNQGRS